MDDQASAIAEAFSRKALVYDDFGEDHENLARMRQKVRAHVLGYLPPANHLPASRILELNAGTGADAAFFASQGYRVHAIDLSPGMVAQIEAKIVRYNLSDRLTVQLCSFLDLEQVSGGPFQYVFSNMGGVNCTADLERVIRGLQKLLAPGAYVTWVVMPPTCLWEMAMIFRGDLRTAARRLSKGGVPSNVEGVQFLTYYYTPKQVIEAFGKQFKPLKVGGLSVFTPTADRKQFARLHPKLYRFLSRLDGYLADRPPFYRWGDFFILTLRYIPGN